MKKISTKIILGVDPGTAITGYGLISVSGSKIVALAAGVIQLNKLGLSHPEKLNRIFQRITGIIAEFNPSVLSIEAPFYGKNIQSTLKLGRAQGVVLAAAMTFNLEIVEFAPRKVKKAVTGIGNASKHQVAEMVKKQISGIKIEDEDGVWDAYDALAVALCYQHQARFGDFGNAKKSAGWSDFIKNNPNRVK